MKELSYNEYEVLMTQGDWSSASTVPEAWLQLSKNYGDIYRRLLVNPIISGLLQQQDSLQEPPLFAALYQWLNEDGKSFEPLPDKPDSWYAAWSTRTLPQKIRILDIGCGDGYRGRWLKHKRVTYKGIDGSDQLVAAGQASKLDVNLDNLELPGVIAKNLSNWNGEHPHWIFLITVLDHLKNPQQLLSEIAQLYDYGDEGNIFVVTCNPRFYRQPITTDGSKPTTVEIETIKEGDAHVQVYFRTRTHLRRLFRDAGLHVIDELSPWLPNLLAYLRGEIREEAFNGAIPPLHFWLLRAQSTKRSSVSKPEIQAWANELASLSSIRQKATGELLAALMEHDEHLCEKLYWRKIPPGVPVTSRVNLGGRLFVPRRGTFELYEGSARSLTQPLTDTIPVLRFERDEYFGELELFIQDEERARMYTRSVYAAPQQPAGLRESPELLEIPSDVVQRLMKNPNGLGSPMLGALRRKVLDTLLTPPRTHWEKALVSGKAKGSLKTTKRDVVTAAALVAQALEADRERGAYALDARRVVCIWDPLGAVERYFKRSPKAPELNSAFEFLQEIGVLRIFRGRDRALEKLFPLSETEKERGFSFPKCAVPKNKDWDDVHAMTHGNGNEFEDKRVVFEDKFLASMNYCMFIVEDEFLLRRLVVAPDESLMKNLYERYLTYFNPPDAVIKARHIEVLMACISHWNVRFSKEIWQRDSLGCK